MTINPMVVKAYAILFQVSYKVGEITYPKYIQSESERKHELQIVYPIKEEYKESVSLYIVENFA